MKNSIPFFRCKMSVAENSCHVCHGPVGDAHKCKKCLKYVHLFCGISGLDEETEGYGQETVCKTCHAGSTGKSQTYPNADK